MKRTTCCLNVFCMVLLVTSCAQSVHQTERLTRRDFVVDSGYADDQFYSYWPGPGYGAGYWGSPLGYYGASYGPFGLGWYRGDGGLNGVRQLSRFTKTAAYASSPCATAIQEKILRELCLDLDDSGRFLRPFHSHSVEGNSCEHKNIPAHLTHSLRL